MSLTYLDTYIPTYLQPRDPHGTDLIGSIIGRSAVTQRPYASRSHTCASVH